MTRSLHGFKAEAFYKFRFTGRAGITSGFVLEGCKLANMTIPDMSRMFPYSEAGKMDRVEVSPPYDTWNDAFGHHFPGALPQSV